MMQTGVAMTDNAPATGPNVGQLILHYLKLEGVQHLFGIPGGGIMWMLDALYKARGDFHYVICRQETGAAYMADGYARMTGKPGVVLVTTGPGATNSLTGVVNADAAGSPLLLLTGEIAEALFGSGYLQEGVNGKLDVNAVLRGACASSAMITSGANAQTLIEAALRTAMGTPRRAAHLSLPWDVTLQVVAPSATRPIPATPAVYRARPAVADIAGVKSAATLLLEAQRPLILLGNGCRAALRDPATRAALTDLVEAGQVPVMTTANGKGVFPEDHSLSLRAFGLADCMWPYGWFGEGTDHVYDVLLVIGSGLGEMATDKWKPNLKPNGTIIQVDADARMIGRDYAIDLPITGEAGDFICRLSKAVPSGNWDPAKVAARSAQVAAIKATSPFADPASYLSDSAPIHPAALCRVLQEGLVGTPSAVLLDAGNCVGWGLHYLVAGPDLEVHPSLDMGPMGFAVAAVVGAKMAAPDKVCVALTGDGAFMMQGAEISTAQHNGVGAIWVVLQDNDLAMVSQGMEMVTSIPPAVPVKRPSWETMFSLGNPDLVQFAQGLGAKACSVTTPAEMAAALAAAMQGALSGQPQVIVAQIDRSAEPPYYIKH